MRINRPANDFFKQACLEVLEVTGVQGLGVALSGENVPGLIGTRSIYGPLQPSRPAASASPRRRADPIASSAQAVKGPVAWSTTLAHDNQSPPHGLSNDVRQLMAVPLQREDVVLGCLFALGQARRR